MRPRWLDLLRALSPHLEPDRAPPPPPASAPDGRIASVEPAPLSLPQVVDTLERIRPSFDELRPHAPRLEAALGALVVPTLGVPIEPHPMEYLFKEVQSAMDRHRSAMEAHAKEIYPYLLAPELDRIPQDRVDDRTPYWNNDYFPAGDARLAYAVIARYQPRKILEIGCGNSTKFMRRAIEDHKLASRIICVDPAPRADVSGVADEIYRARLQDMDPAFFEQLEPGDVLFLDGSHLVFNGSDCVRFFLEILPRLRDGVWVHIHDIFLPYDYPYQLFHDCKSNEQYLLAMLLLASPAWIPIFPIYYAQRLGILPHGGGSFWMRRQEGNL